MSGICKHVIVDVHMCVVFYEFLSKFMSSHLQNFLASALQILLAFALSQLLAHAARVAEGTRVDSQL